MNTQVQNIVNSNATKTAKIILLLELGLTRTQIADLQVLGKYGAIQNVFAKWQTARLTQPSRLCFIASSFNQKFGVEMEAFGIDKHKVARELRNAGIDCNVEGYNHTTRASWKIVTDASLTGDNTWELVSPPLVGEAGLTELKIVSDVLVRLRVKINRTCGMHIHFEAANWTVATWRNLFKNYSRFQATIDSFMPSSRHNSNYSRNLTANVTETTLFQKLDNITTIQSFENLYSSRYYNVNAKAYARHRTVEFRQHSGTIEFLKIEKWIRFLDFLVQYGEQGFVATSGEFEKLGDFCNTEIMDYLHVRRENFAA